MTVTMSGPPLALATCARRLAPVGARTARDLSAASEERARVALELDGERSVAAPALELDVSWFAPAAADTRRGSEAVIQAMSGLMAVHGRDAGGPRRIGLEVASVAAGVLAGHAVLAALVGASRGATTSRVETSVLRAALLLVSHRVAAATAGNEWVPAPAGPAPGPPFRSGDGHWFEIETLDPAAWRAFWERLGAAQADLGWAWKLFRPRYFRGTCTLPSGLHEATRARPLSEIAAAADDCRVSLCRVRSYDEVLEEPGPSEGHPVMRSLPGVARPPAAPPPPEPGALPLAGLRVVEATSRLQGPLAGLLLQTLGADVVRVEPPGGDLARTVPPLAGGVGSFYLCFNRGKQRVEVDLGRRAGRAELAELAAGADVFLQNWRPGKAAEWGLEADDLVVANPKLVYARASGWGDVPGLAHLVGTDYLVQAYSGVGAGINPEGHPPFPSRALLTDYMGALVTCEAVLSGLYLRERSGAAQRVEASLLSGAMTLQAHVLETLVSGREKGRQRGRPVWGPLDHPLPTADGVLVATVTDDDDLQRFCRACGLDLERSAPESIEELAAERIAEDTTGAWEQRLNEAGLACAAACTDLAALPADARLSGLFEPLAGSAFVPVPPWTLTS